MASELEAANQGNVYDAVRQLRPEWLNRTTSGRRGDDAIAAYMDEQFLGGASALTRMPLSNIKRIRFLSVSEAQVRFSQTNALRNAIVVEMDRP